MSASSGRQSGRGQIEIRLERVPMQELESIAVKRQDAPPHAEPGPLRFLFVLFAGWVNRDQRDLIAYPFQENRVLNEQLGR